MFFLIALVLFGFAVHTLGKNKNTMFEGLETENSDMGDLESEPAESNEVVGAVGLEDSGEGEETETESEGEETESEGEETESEGEDMLTGAGTDKNTVGETNNDEPVGVESDGELDGASNVESSTEKTSDSLLPKDSNSPESLLPKTSGANLAQQLPVNDQLGKNATHDVRGDVPIPQSSEKHHWNQSTIEHQPGKTLEIQGGPTTNDVPGFSLGCPLSMSSTVENSGNPILTNIKDTVGSAQGAGSTPSATPTGGAGTTGDAAANTPDTQSGMSM